MCLTPISGPSAYFTFARRVIGFRGFSPLVVTVFGSIFGIFFYYGAFKYWFSSDNNTSDRDLLQKALTALAQKS